MKVGPMQIPNSNVQFDGGVLKQEGNHVLNFLVALMVGMGQKNE